MLGNLFQQSKSCIQCGNRLKNSSIALNDHTFIDQQCLQFIQQTIAQGNADEDMLLYYQYILSLVPACQKCNNIIDGKTKKRGNEGVNPPICSNCMPVKKEQSKPPEFCALCQKQLSQKLYKDIPIEIEGMKICQKCYNYQLKGLEEKKQKEQKPDFGQFAFRGKPKLVREQEKQQKKCSFDIKPDLKCKLETEYKKEIPKYPFLRDPNNKLQQKNDSSDDNFFNPFHLSYDLFNPTQARTQKSGKCKSCQASYKSQPKDYNQGLCPPCFKTNSKRDNQRRRAKQDSFGLDALFTEVKQADEPLPDDHLELIQLPPLPPLVPITQQPETKVEVALDSHNYDLKGCKICFNAQSTMINQKCRHLMMCEQCYKQMMTRRKITNGMMPCPYCATLGKYSTYIEPIYI